MSVIGISMVKNERDIIAATVAHMASQVDRLIISDNASDDGTRDILAGLANNYNLLVLDDPDPAYYQSRKMSFLARKAAEEGASWVVPFDADEIWYVPDSTLRDLLNAQPHEVAIVQAQLFDHVATGHDPADDNPLTRIGWRRVRPLELPKIACRPARDVVISQGNHHANYPAVVSNGIVVRHFPYRSLEHFVRKAVSGAAAYAATDLPESWGAHWRQWGALHDALGEEALHEVFRKWYWVADPTVDESLLYDPAPAST